MYFWGKNLAYFYNVVESLGIYKYSLVQYYKKTLQICSLELAASFVAVYNL